MTTYRIAVEVATGWASPDAPRALDRPAVADQPDLAAWTRTLDDNDARLGLHGRTLTQMLAGEPVAVLEESGDWLRVAARWQPVSHHDDGYVSWVRRTHVVEATDAPGAPPARAEPDAAAVLACGRRFLGLPYLWGGTSPYGMDCSGLVHYCYRQAGVVVPRDSPDQQQAAEPVPLGEERPGDLYFFAPEGRVTHVGFVTGRLRMLHAPEGSVYAEDAALAPARRESLVAAGRFPLRPDTA